jgi:hypothetical protein
MSFEKNTSFNDRLKAAAEAKKAQLAKFKPKPHQPDPNFHEREAIRHAELDAVRQRRLAEKEALRQAAEAEKQAQVEEALNAEEAELEAKRAERKARKAEAKAAARLKREMKKR